MLDTYAREFPALNVIANTVARASEITGHPMHLLLGRRRFRPLARTRFAIMWALRQAGFNVVQIGQQLGYADHTTVIHGTAEAKRLRAEDPAFRELSDKLLLRAVSLATRRAEVRHG